MPRRHLVRRVAVGLGFEQGAAEVVVIAGVADQQAAGSQSTFGLIHTAEAVVVAVGLGLGRTVEGALGPAAKVVLAALFTGSLAGTVLASVSCALQIGLSGAVPVAAAVSAMAFYHFFVGLGEGAIGVLLVGISVASVPVLYKAGVVQ